MTYNRMHITTMNVPNSAHNVSHTLAFLKFLQEIACKISPQTDIIGLSEVYVNSGANLGMLLWRSSFGTNSTNSTNSNGLQQKVCVQP
jgi:hypothetical protein